MLTEENQVIFNLLKELRDVCEKQKIPYFLGPRLTLHAFMNLGMPLNPTAAQILVKPQDMEKLRKYLIKNLPEGRFVESMMDGGSFPGFSLRYENLDTLYLSPNLGTDYAYPCMNVRILPLRPGLYENRGSRIRYVERSFRESCQSVLSSEQKEGHLKRLPCRVLFRVARRKLGPWLYKKLLKSSKWGKKVTDCFVFISDEPFTFPAAMFEKRKKVTLEGEKFWVPKNVNGYLTAYYGQNYPSMTENYVQSPKAYFSTRISGKEYIEAPQARRTLSRFAKRRGRVFLLNKKIRYFRTRLDDGWMLARLIAKKITVDYTIRKQSERIVHLWQDKEYGRIAETFGPYTKLLKECAEKKEACPVLDPKLLAIYEEMLELTGSFSILDLVRNGPAQYDKALEEEP